MKLHPLLLFMITIFLVNAMLNVTLYGFAMDEINKYEDLGKSVQEIDYLNAFLNNQTQAAQEDLYNKEIHGEDNPGPNGYMSGASTYVTSGGAISGKVTDVFDQGYKVFGGMAAIVAMYGAVFEGTSYMYIIVFLGFIINMINLILLAYFAMMVYSFFVNKGNMEIQ